MLFRSSIGLIPKELSRCCEAVGNTSLGGAVEYLLRGDRTEENDKGMQELLSHTEEITLAEDDDFNDNYMKYMFF